MRQEVMTGAERRRRWSDAEKRSILGEVGQRGATVAEVARQHDLTRQHIYQWRAVIQRAKLARETLHSFFDLAPRVLIGMEACPGSQWLARRLIEMGHDARIIPARFVKPSVKSNKTDTVDAAAIAEAVTRPTMRFVEVRTAEQVDLQALHRIRGRLVGERTGLMNQARAFLASNMGWPCGIC